MHPAPTWTRVCLGRPEGAASEPKQAAGQQALEPVVNRRMGVTLRLA
jgi:hypothetical protein